ncbi:MAG TPA: MATE family efflux transporter [Melioribacteraceae bacterium]|mgnify:CR=1 FL=1|nr:MATE family efflux transporter [Melioribacteraceae bacterium]
MKTDYKQNIKETIKLALPISIGQLGHILMAVTDTIMVGHLGAMQLAAASVANAVFSTFMIFGLGLSIAITPITAVYVGAKDTNKLKSLLYTSLIINMIAGIIILLAIIWGSNYLAYLNQPKDVTILMKSYFQVIGISILPIMLFQSYKQFLEGLSDVKSAMYINLLANVANIILNWVLIYGKFGFPALGLLGAGIATLLTRTIMSISFWGYFQFNNKYKQLFASLSSRLFEKAITKKILSIGLPLAGQMVTEVAAFSFIGIMVGWIGTNELAAHQIALNMASSTFMIMIGISSAGTVRVGNALGEKNFSKVKVAGYTAISICIAIMFIFGLVFVFLNNYLPYIYIQDINVINITAKLLLIAAAFQIFDGWQASSAGVLRGLGDVTIPAIIIFIAYWVIGIPLGYYLAFTLKWSVYGIWASVVISLIFVAVFLFFRFIKLEKKLELKKV